MDYYFPKHFFYLFLILSLFQFPPSTRSALSKAKTKIFREYIGAEGTGIKFSDIPINPNVEFHYILAFAIDYTTDDDSPSPTNGKFNVFWDEDNLSPEDVLSIKSQHKDVKMALSIGGDSIGNRAHPSFNPDSVKSWVSNAVSSLTKIIKKYHLDGLDIDYEYYQSDPDTFAQCIGQLITKLKKEGVISFASIAPLEDEKVQSFYSALWNNYGNVVDYVNFQFYTYDEGISVDQFIKYFKTQNDRYNGGKMMASFTTDGRGGLGPGSGFIEACNILRQQGLLGGIFVWSAVDTKSNGYNFKFEKQSQSFLAGSD